MNTFRHGYALLIGIGACAYQPWSLPVTVKDMRAVHALLVAPEHGAYPDDEQHIRVLQDAAATREAILESLAWAARQADEDPQATILLYYSGHGWLNQASGEYYLIPYDVDPYDLPSSALAAYDFHDAIRQINAERLLVLLDCCHAAGMATAKGAAIAKLPPQFIKAAPPKGLVDGLKQGKGRAVYTSSSGAQLSWVRPDQALSIYTYHLLEALQGASNQAGDTLVRLSDLMNHLGKRVNDSAQQLCGAEQTPFFDTATEDFPIALLKGGKGLATDATPKEEPLDPILWTYLSQVILDVGTLDLAGIANPIVNEQEHIHLELSAIYTALDIIATDNETESASNPQSGQALGADDSHLRERNARQRKAALAFVNETPYAVLLGDPGSGKSTFVNFLALCLAGELVQAPNANLAQLGTAWSLPPLLPIRLLLRNVASHMNALSPHHPEEAIWRYITHELGQRSSDFERVLEKYLLDVGGILIVDGLDEAPEAKKQQESIKTAILGFRRQFPRVRILLTSRTYAYRSQQWRLPGFGEAILAPFDERQIQQFIERWYTHIGPLRSRMTAEDSQGRIRLLKQAIQQSHHLQELAYRPLLLTLLTSLHAWRGGNLPDQRQELYAASVDLLMDTWERNKIIYDETGKPVLQTESASEWFQSPRKQILEVIEELAFQAHHKTQHTSAGLPASGEIAEEDLVHALYKIASPDMKTKRVIEYIRDRAGLLINHAEGLYRFPHRSFQEYLAARYLVKHPKRLVELTRQAPGHWREVLLWAALKADSNPWALWPLVQRLCPLPTMQPAANDWAVALLAGQVLAETGIHQAEELDLVEQQTLQAVMTWLRNATQQAALPLLLRVNASSTLGSLGDQQAGSGCKADGLPEIDWVTIEAGGFLMGSEATVYELPGDYAISRYPITVAQYQAFFLAGGYQQQQYWTPAGWAWRQKAGIIQPQRYTSVYQTPNHPQVGVSWYEAVAFCRWLSQQLGVTVRLPTEIEWERAARHRDGRTYPWGNSFAVNLCNMRETGIGATSPVGFFVAGNAACGAADMAGNVWEWCSTAWHSQWHDDVTTQTGIEEVEETTIRRVLRGGSFSNERQLIRCAQRHRNYPDHRSWNTGFRVIQSASN